MLARLLAILLLLCASPAYAVVDWDEGFEYADAAALWAVWDESCQSNPTLSTDRAQAGSKSLKEVFAGRAGVDPGAGGCSMRRNLTAPSETIYTRFYVSLINFIADPVASKMMFVGSNCCYPSFWWAMMPGRTLIVGAQGVVDANGVRSTINYYTSGAIPQATTANPWACVETRITMSSPGVGNGVLQAWINGIQVLNRTDIYMRPTSNVGSPPATPTAKHEFISLYVQHGVGTIYYDGVAVDRTARIGCSGAPPPPFDNTPPTAPSSLVAQ